MRILNLSMDRRAVSRIHAASGRLEAKETKTLISRGTDATVKIARRRGLIFPQYKRTQDGGPNLHGVAMIPR